MTQRLTSKLLEKCSNMADACEWMVMGEKMTMDEAVKVLAGKSKMTEDQVSWAVFMGVNFKGSRSWNTKRL